MMKKTVLLFVVMVISNCLLYGETKFQTTTKDLGTFEIGLDAKHKISVVLEDTETGDEVVHSVIVKDTNKTILYRRNYYLKSDKMEITAQSADYPTGGKVLLIMKYMIQSPPNSGLSGQYFCFNKLNQFVPLTGDLIASSDEASSKSFQITKENDNNDCVVNVDHWTGYFMVTYNYRIMLEGTSSDICDNEYCDNYDVKIDTEDAKKYRIERADYDDHSALLFAQPGKDQTSKKIQVTVDSKIEFLGASPYANTWWLHVKIDGLEGYVGVNDFWVIGLSCAG